MRSSRRPAPACEWSSRRPRAAAAALVLSGFLNPSRLAANEALFRDVNERIKETSLRIDAAAVEEAGRYLEFLCECADVRCRDHLEVTLEEYEEVRSESTHFLVRPGHQNGGIESTVWSSQRFVVVEKVVAEDFLEATDPRA
jgi:hypothetical protein